MLFKIENNKSKQKLFIIPNRQYIVGRQDSDLIVADKSVSRRHAKLSIDNEKQLIFIEDLSRFGTFINSNKLINKSGFLKSGDTITFGAQPGVDFQCSIVQFDLIISTLIQSEKIKLLKYTGVFGGKLLNDWNEHVQYLVMSNLKVTYKVICALIKQVPIVTPDFIKEMHDFFIGKRSDEPLADNFLPPTVDVNIVDQNISFKTNIIRQTLFYGKTFYFLSSKKRSHLELAILSATGKVVLINESNLLTTTTELNSANSIVMYESGENSLVTEVYRILKQCRKRPVIDSEIGFAVLHVSVNEYCNPSKACTNSIYKDTHLSQVLTINPFHIDTDVPKNNDLANCDKRILQKRMYTEDDTSIESILKKRKLVTNECNEETLNKTEKDNIKKSNQTQLMNLDQSSDKFKENIEINKRSPMKRKTPLENLLKDNNNFFYKPSNKGLTKAITKCADFDDDFDQLELPNLHLETNVECLQNKEDSLFTKSNIDVIESQLKELHARQIQKECSQAFDQIVHLIEGDCLHARITDLGSDTLSNDVPDTKDKMTIFRSLVVEDLIEASKVNFNFKTFKKVSPVYINDNPVALDTFKRNKY